MACRLSVITPHRVRLCIAGGRGDGGALTGQPHRLGSTLAGESLRREATGVERAQLHHQDTPQHEDRKEHPSPAEQQGHPHPRHVQKQPVHGIETPVCPENLKPLISLTFFEFLSMLEQRTPPSSHMLW